MQELVDTALRDIKRIGAMQAAGQRVRMLEVGCGSGCVSLAILNKAADCVGMAIDVSGDAVALTLENAKRCAKRLWVLARGQVCEEALVICKVLMHAVALRQ